MAITTDGWTSRATESYVTITSCHISEEWCLKNYVLQTRSLPVSHTGINIANVIKQAITEWGLPEHPPLVSDNAANMIVAAKEVGSNPHLPCYAHTLNLAVQKGLKINSISSLLGRIRRVVAFFHRSTTAAAVLKEKLKLLGLREVKLIHDVATRWNSAVDLLERFLELQPAVYAALMSKDIRSKETDIATMTEDDITLSENIMAVLIPLRTVTTALCSESIPTASLILPLQNPDIGGTTEGPSDQDIIQPKEDTKPAGLASILEDVIITKTEKGTKTKLDQAKQEMEVYMNTETLNLGSDPLQWWKDNSWRLPLLARLAKEHLCVPATSVPSERVFGTAGDILSAQRASLNADKVDMLIFLKKNMP